MACGAGMSFSDYNYAIDYEDKNQNLARLKI